MEKNLMTMGVPGFDDILGGGIPKGRVYLVAGQPGTGKTTLGLQFLLEGKRLGERVMLISFIETIEELVEVAKSHGWSLEGIHMPKLFHDMIDSATTIQTVFSPSEVEFGEMTNIVIDAIKQYKPDRLLLDSVSQLSMMTDSWYRLKGPIIKLRDTIHSMDCTALFTSSYGSENPEELETIVHGSILLSSTIPSFGQIRRELIIKKIRGKKFITGYHNYSIQTGGMVVYTWPKIFHDSIQSKWKVLSSGIEQLDKMLGGGLEEGTACLITGSTGTGKSTIASLYVQAAAKRGENSVIFCFDERKDTFLRRSDALGLGIDYFVEQGLVDLRQVNVSDLSPGEFAQVVRAAVEEKNARVVVIDSLSGYMSSMPGENMLMIQLHELLSYLSSVGVLTIMVVTKYGTAYNTYSDVDASYIADTILLIKHFEAYGNLHRFVAVVKKRHGIHEHNIREFKIESGGCKVGPPLGGNVGIFEPNPTYTGDIKKLMENRPDFPVKEE
jgi:circadian clock protein KaiC